LNPHTGGVRYHCKMAALLEPFAGKDVFILTKDGRHLRGTLVGFDQTVNAVLKDCYERTYVTEADKEADPDAVSM